MDAGMKRAIMCSAIGIGVGCVALWIAGHTRSQEVDVLIGDIRDHGGEATLGLSEWECIRRGVNPFGDTQAMDCVVQLEGAAFTRQWLHQRRHLTGLSISHLFVSETSLDGSDLAVLLQHHHLVDINARGLSRADTFACASSNDSLLAVLDLSRSDLSDEGMRCLPLESIEVLDISGTFVGETGCEELRRAALLADLRLGDRQLTAQVVTLLSHMPSLRTLSLVGSGIGDADIMALECVTALRYLYLLDTSVTSHGIKHVQSALSRCEIVVDE